MTRLRKRHGGGLNPKSLRSTHTSRIRPIMIWGCTLYNNKKGKRPLTQPLLDIELTDLRSITGAYQGSSRIKLGFIANVEPLQVILDHASKNWAARNTASGDPLWQ